MPRNNKPIAQPRISSDDKPMHNPAISNAFEQMADIMEILGDDRFRINTYRKVARIIAETPIDVADLLDSGQLADVPGIGKSSIAKIQQYIDIGQIEAHQDLLARIPPTLLDLLSISGMGPKSVKAIYEQLEVTSIDQLKTDITKITKNKEAFVKEASMKENRLFTLLAGLRDIWQDTELVNLIHAEGIGSMPQLTGEYHVR